MIRKLGQDAADFREELKAYAVLPSAPTVSIPDASNLTLTQSFTTRCGLFKMFHAPVPLSHYNMAHASARTIVALSARFAGLKFTAASCFSQWSYSKIPAYNDGIDFHLAGMLVCTSVHNGLGEALRTTLLIVRLPS
eukprot:3375282-Amphidinium_carterae.1